jgi:hypothetical protein
MRRQLVYGVFGEPPHPLAPSPTRGEEEPDSLAPLSPCGRGAGGEGLYFIPQRLVFKYSIICQSKND